jgi:uncharacterized protein YdeI (YjbR/CyaY-like superfamily)
MAPVIPNPEAIMAFPNQADFETWLRAHHDTATELYLRIYKNGTGLPTVTYAEALDVALCWGWIDGLKKSYDENSFLQRFSPRKGKSIWSQINRHHVDRLTASGRMTPHGQRHIDAAKADGRWEAAYAAQSEMTVPDDLLAAIEAEPKALEMFQTLNRQNLFALAFRIRNIKTDAARAKRIAGFVEMLARGETIYPNGRKPEKP